MNDDDNGAHWTLAMTIDNGGNNSCFHFSLPFYLTIYLMTILMLKCINPQWHHYSLSYFIIIIIIKMCFFHLNHPFTGIDIWHRCYSGSIEY